MGFKKQKYLKNTPFQAPHAKAKHASNQVGGETRRTQTEIINAIQVSKRT
ncbi:YpzG family protein [Virgibacillus sp. MSP4-1]|nr:YpzG family protein [Virgibacillus sp. MSP4-1]QHS24290.1 YpzG family protein [Virgibacillus sp. MSP4-1]